MHFMYISISMSDILQMAALLDHSLLSSYVLWQLRRDFPQRHSLRIKTVMMISVFVISCTKEYVKYTDVLILSKNHL